MKNKWLRKRLYKYEFLCEYCTFENDVFSVSLSRSIVVLNLKGEKNTIATNFFVRNYTQPKQIWNEALSNLIDEDKKS